ncbi:hypothetical protein HK097_000828 [Rhizophlyctis rosea]|uniref:Protein kinase domain-containing protein n=1 Tax=Rhizophlyctis rosea TaxID=64517 RepID=A0AAD5SGB8_9FUNG|nr:hypothetical protein HK097_000828 [Rhizophlyctis rosea]
MTLSSASSLPMAVPRVTAKRLERFFGERPPSEMICDNLEQFFPGIQDMDVEVITENDAESVAGEEGEIVPIDDTGFIFDSTGSVSGTLKRMRHRSVKQMVEENILVKRLSRSSGPSGGLGGTNTSFGRRLSRVVGQPMRPGVSRAATIDGVGAVSGLAGSRSVREEWRDRIASIDEEGSILTGRNAEWAPLPVPVAAQLGVGSDGELDKESGRRKSFASLRRQALLPAGVSEVLPGESSEARGSVLMEEHRGPGHNLTRRKSDGDIASTKCRGISIAELKELAASSAELASGSRKMENELKSGSSKPSDSLPHSIRSIRLRPSQESLAGSARKSLRVRISQEALRTSNSRTSFHRYSTETLSHESLDESGSKSLSDVASVKSFSSNLSQSPSASASIGSLPRRPTLARAFTHAPDTPRSVDWIKGDLIGSGSFGRVYYGVNVLTGEIMAVKQVELADARSLPPKAAVAGGGIHALRKRMVDALHQEITLLKDLNHENIVRYLGYDVQGNMINVFLEYVSGGSVASSLSKMGSFEEELVRSISCQVLSGLEYLHERSIIHRDIKGGNILLDENGVAKISDFGISKKNEYKMAYRYNSRMSIQGSVYWMAPEVIKAKGYSAKVDIWSLGCVVLEMFTGGNPWKQLDELQTMWRLGRENTPPIPDDLSDDGKRFIEKCFTIDPDQRPTATQMLMDRFADVDPAEFDFKSCKERAIERLRQEEEEDDLDFEGSWIGTDISTLPEMLEEVGGTSSGLGSRMSILERRRRGSGMPIARVASAKMMDGLSLGVGLRRKSERKSGLRLETGFSDSDGTGSELNSASTTGGRGSVVATDQIGEGTEGELTPLTGTTCIGTAGLGRETAPGEGKSKPDVGEEPAKAVFVVGDDDHDSDAVA